MYKLTLFFALLCVVKSEESRRIKYIDPFAALDRHISHSLAFHYLWPWSEIMRTAAALDAEKSLEEPQIISERDRMEVNLNVKRFKPDELRIKVKNRYIIVEGKHKENRDDKRFMANHFVQRFVLPAGSKPEEVTAVLKQNGVLSISAPRHELPPPPPEREVPIQVMTLEEKNEKKTEKKTSEENKTDEKKSEEKKIEEKKSEEKKSEGKKSEDEKTQNRVEKPESITIKEPSIPTSSVSPIEQLDLVEATTHVGKIRKKELKTATKASKVNEVTKGGENNGLDYSLIEVEE